MKDDGELRTAWTLFQAENPALWQRDFGDLRTPAEVASALKWGERHDEELYGDEALLPVTRKLLRGVE
jgi:hypothetical protein